MQDDQNSELRAEIDRLKTALQESDAKWIVANKKTQDAEELVKVAVHVYFECCKMSHTNAQKAKVEVTEVEERWLAAREEARQARRDCAKWRDEAEAYQRSTKTIEREVTDQQEVRIGYSDLQIHFFVTFCHWVL